MALFRGRRARGRTKPSGGSPITSQKDGFENPLSGKDDFEVPVFKGDEPKP